jgi:hypothetical protein
VKHIDINDAFHRLVDGGLSVEAAWRKLTGRDLRMWCNGKPIARDYLDANVRFIIRNGDFVPWPAGGGLGFNPFEYSFTVDAERFERLLSRRRVGRPRKEVTASDVKQEKARRGKAGRPASQNALAKHFGIGRRTVGRLLKEIIAPK